MGIMEYTAENILKLLEAETYKMYEQINDFITDNYNVNQIWDVGGKYGDICIRYSRSGKTLCTLYFRQKQLGIWIIFGKSERSKFEEMRNQFSFEVQEKYDSTKVYHDGKWLMFNVEDNSLFNEIVLLLSIKKSPNRKLAMCGYCCDMCKAFVLNIKKKDERNALSEYWKDYYDLDLSPENISCEGCRCTKANAHRIDDSCPVRSCVLDKEIIDCSECEEYPCDTFLSRKGLNYEEAYQIKKIDVAEYYDFLCAFDNKSRLDRKKLIKDRSILIIN
jgi:hypothetical protein